MRANYFNRTVSEQAYGLGFNRNATSTKKKQKKKTTRTGSRKVKRSTVKEEIVAGTFEVFKLIKPIILCAEHPLIMVLRGSVISPRWGKKVPVWSSRSLS